MTWSFFFCHEPFISHAYTHTHTHPRDSSSLQDSILHIVIALVNHALSSKRYQLFEDLSDHEFETLPWTTIPNCERDRKGAHILTRNFNFRSGKSRKRRPGHGPRRAIECPFQLRWMKEFSLVVLLFDVCHSFDQGLNQKVHLERTFDVCHCCKNVITRICRKRNTLTRMYRVF